jgi:hypothetical protein
MKLHELTRALNQGKIVYWKNDGYTVHWSNDVIRVTYTQNGFGSVLHASELSDCYIKNQ